MLGVAPKRMGIFGARQPWQTPGLGGGMGMGEQPTQKPHNLPQTSAPPKKKGLFGTGIQLGDVIGIAGDAVAINRGMTPMFAEREQEARLAKQKQALEEAARLRERDEWLYREQYKRENPAPISNDTANDYAFWQSKLTPEQFEQWKANKVNPPVWRQGQDGRFYRMETGPSGDAPDTLPADFNFGDGGPQAGPAATFPPRR